MSHHGKNKKCELKGFWRIYSSHTKAPQYYQNDVRAKHKNMLVFYWLLNSMIHLELLSVIQPILREIQLKTMTSNKNI